MFIGLPVHNMVTMYIFLLHLQSDYTDMLKEWMDNLSLLWIISSSG